MIETYLEIDPFPGTNSETLENLHPDDSSKSNNTAVVELGLPPHFTLPPSPSEDNRAISYSASGLNRSPVLPSDPPSETLEPGMTFSSSPVQYPPSSSPVPVPPKKRRLFQTINAAPPAKKSRTEAGLHEGEEDIASGPVAAPDLLSSKYTNKENKQLQKPVESSDDLNVGEDSTPPDFDSSRPALSPIPRLLLRKLPPKSLDLRTSTGGTVKISPRAKAEPKSYEHIIAQRSTSAPGRAKKSYYGIEIHQLTHEAKLQQELREAQVESDKQQVLLAESQPGSSREPESREKTADQLWTEKYRAKKFTDLVGDERTHRLVLRWLKAWDDVVFSANKKVRSRRVYAETTDQERQHRKILLLTGPPGLGKTTLAHVCARQAGYETLEINASDDRSRDVVKGRIKDALGTETVRGIKEQGKARKAGRPACVIVDEVDGVVTGSSGSGEGGFIKALIDLVHLDQRNCNEAEKVRSNGVEKRKGDKFRLLRPLVLICNDVYAPSLRPLRTSGLAEIVHLRRPPLDKLIARMKTVFETEKIACDNDAVRRVCESSWGMGTRRQSSLGGRGAGEGDIRGILVQAEWIAHKFRSQHGHQGKTKLSRKWVETHLEDSQSSKHQQGLGRGGIKEVIDRIFVEGAGLPNLPTSLSTEDARLVAEAKTTALGVADLRKRAAITSLREMLDTCGDHDRAMTACFAAYPTQVFQDDVQLSKPNEAYEWLHFHDSLSSRVFGGQEWELSPYLSTGACGFHHLFAAVDKGDRSWNEEKKDEEDVDAHPFSGPRADFAAYEAEKQSKTMLTELQSSFSASLLRLFSSVDAMATELMPNAGRMLSPDVKPVVIGGSGESASVASVRKDSEKLCVENAVRVMSALEVRLEKVRVEADGTHGRGGYVYRMEPPLDTLITFHTDKTFTTTAPPVRYAVRQVLDQELRKVKILQDSMARQARSSGPTSRFGDPGEDKENEQRLGKPPSLPAVGVGRVKRDFFGRIVNESRPTTANELAKHAKEQLQDKGRVWVSFHEGFSNAVRKPITLKELLESF